jgi:adenylate cyclase
MDRIWQWAWDRYGARYSWAMCAVFYPMLLLVWLFPAFFIVAFEKSDRFMDAVAVTVVAVPVLVYLYLLPGVGRINLAERWAAADEVDRATALADT